MKTKKTASLNIVRKPIKSLIPHPKNPRVHPESQMAKLQHSIDTFDYAKGSIVIQKSTGYILAGHGIVEALKTKGYQDVDVVEVDLSAGQAEAFMIADNKLGDDSLWDNTALNALLTELTEIDIPLLDAGFDEDSLSELIKSTDSGIVIPPEDFKEYGDDIETKYCCPKCGYEWSGKPKSDGVATA